MKKSAGRDYDLVRSRTFGCAPPAHPVPSVRCACACPHARVWRAHSPFLTLLAPRSDVGTCTCLQVVCTCHARAFPPLLCAIRRDRFRGPARAAKGGAGDLPRPLLDSSRNGGLRPLEAAAAASSPSPKGGLAAPFVPALAAAEPAITTAVATAVSL